MFLRQVCFLNAYSSGLCGCRLEPEKEMDEMLAMTKKINIKFIAQNVGKQAYWLSWQELD